MANGIFFVSWELWQQMTFILAMGIVAVFCAGLMKLWWNNRLVKKQELLDEEKRLRVEEMRRSGLGMKRTNDIPFGVRAIQGGVEVDGIWISRPASQDDPATAKLVSSNSTASSQSSALPPVSQVSLESQRPLFRTMGGLNEDTLRSLEGHGSRQPHDIYVPTSSQQIPRYPSQQSSASSLGESASARSGSGKGNSSALNSRVYAPKPLREGQYQYHQVDSARNGQDSPPDPFQTPARTPSGFSVRLPSRTQTPLLPVSSIPAPEPTFGPGDLHLNRSSRRVNGGFEILPAGTFGGPRKLDHSVNPVPGRTASQSPNKPRT
ncbi:uncharacterized protein PODANS_1_13580 [Podospora anserina S mat+]|uniref:Podospora anserina S mat+ genomic DNA chromosome 1, supercontig 3 n=1 Tax=Podospora anserina (strain S / ATCC MYA-4624 / DSM 980 / FGSC 10383) TaxID=515849 RepID=B2ALS9_PODAN|nr:uncharacterized protein PODANS_1_13580 [Podospora anserina S mat+]CAP64967.1 unnamed protein product [Podospora anserina S mat+]CDP23719.1 Putative protein of unknown function [Podospora anserina S mat+]